VLKRQPMKDLSLSLGPIAGTLRKIKIEGKI
jgi:hypothetical protein